MTEKKVEDMLGGFKNLLNESLGKKASCWHGFFNHQGNLQGDRFYTNLLGYVKMAFFGYAMNAGKEVKMETFSVHGVDSSAYSDIVSNLKELFLKVIIDDQDQFGINERNVVLSHDQMFVYLNYRVTQLDAVVMASPSDVDMIEKAIKINKLTETK